MIKALRIAILTLLVGLGGCQQGTPTAASPGFNTMAQQGPESWVIDGASRHIDATYYLALPEGLQFTVEVPVESVPDNDSAAQEQAWPYIRYVYEHKVHLRTQVKRNGSPVQATRIGVALVQHLGVRHRGNRVAMSISDIEARLDSRQNRK
jgi:hypothetical protein